MANKQQLSGMQGVYLVAAELSRRGFIASPTSRSAYGADILVTNSTCSKSFAVQVKTNSNRMGFWLVNAKSKEMAADTHIYVFVNNVRTDPEYYVVPSKVVARETLVKHRPRSTFYSFPREAAEAHLDAWSIFEEVEGVADVE